MYNDACSDEPLSSAAKKKGLSSKSVSPELLNPEQSEEESCSSNNNSNDDNALHVTKSGKSGTSSSSSSLFARELEELIRMEQVHRVALLKQVTSEREQVYGSALVASLFVR